MIIKSGKGVFFFFLTFIHFTYNIVVLYFYKDYSVLTRIRIYIKPSFPPSHPGPLPLDWASRAKVSYLIYCSVFSNFF